MVHSRQFHAGALDWESTVAHDEDLKAAGVEVVGVTPGSIAGEPAQVLRRVEAAHDRARSWPRPRLVTAVQRDSGWGTQAWGSQRLS